jgi:hypothetical protein
VPPWSAALRRFPLVLAAIALGAYTLIHARGWSGDPIVSDGYSYYVYLPDWFLYHDVTLDAVARDCCGGHFEPLSGIHRWPANGRWMNLHPIGTAVLMAPFFVAADALTRWSNFPADGFSFYYQHFVGLAGITYMAVGIGILGRLLARSFTPGVVLAALVTLVWGTNLFHYGTFDPAFSHAYAFCLVAALLALTDAWWRSPRLRTAAALGLVCGLIVLVRHTNVILLLIVPLYGLGAEGSGRSVAAMFGDRKRDLAVCLAAAAAALAPQLLLYHHATGRWLVNAYPDVSHFTFASPHLFGVLFSVEKGLFFWSPVLLLAVFGAIVARGWATRLRVAAIAVFAIDTYLIASWFDWQFGASFGHRGFTDILPLAGVFLASAFAWIWERRPLRAWLAAGVSAAVALSIVQMLQYWMHILPMAGTTWTQYSDVFLRFP